MVKRNGLDGAVRQPPEPEQVRAQLGVRGSDRLALRRKERHVSSGPGFQRDVELLRQMRRKNELTKIVQDPGLQGRADH